MFQTITAPGPSNVFTAEVDNVIVALHGTFGGTNGTLQFQGQDGTWRDLIDDNGRHVFTQEVVRPIANKRGIRVRMNFVGGTGINLHLEMR